MTSKPKSKGASLSHIVHPPSPDAPPDLTKVRTYAACKSCRTKKVKCLPGPATEDGTPGRCQQCVQSSVECVYPPTRDRAAYSRQYVQNLEARVQALESMTGRMAPLLDAYERGNGVVPQTVPSTSHQPDMTEDDIGMDDREDRDEASDSISDMDDGGQMTQDERGNYRWIGSSNTLSLLDSFSRNRSPHEPTPPTPNTNDPGNNPYFGHVAGSGVVKALPGVDEVCFPSAGRAADMVDAFFNEVHPVLPLVEEKSFRAEYQSLMERRARGQPQSAGGFISVVFAIYALGERVISASRGWQRERTKIRDGKAEGNDTVLPGEAEAGVIWYERAQILHYSTLKDVNIHQVQCLTLLAAFQASVNAMPMSWLLAGQAIRVAQDLGLHRSTARMRLTFVEKQIRARCWWALYGLERLVSAQLGRPLGVDDLDIDVAYPLPIDDEALSNLPKNQYEAPEIGEEPHASTISGFIALTKLSKIAGRVAQLLYRPSNGRSVSDPSWSASQQHTINKLDRTLQEWLDHEVPAKYKDPPSRAVRSVQIVSAVLSNAYFAVLLTLHRNFLPSNPDYPRPRAPSNSQSLSRLVDVARSSIHVLAQQPVMIPPSHHLAAACHNLWSSAVILLLCEIQSHDHIINASVGSSVESCRQTLQSLEPAWPGSRKLKELLNEVEARTKEVAASGGSAQRKKRKAGAGDMPSAKRTMSGNMLPPSSIASPRPGSSSNATNRFPGQNTPGRAYETSNTRTAVEGDGSSTSTSNPQSAQVTPPVKPSATLGPTAMDTSQLFDVAGINFDGLEMLQGFDFGTAEWNSFISPTAAAQYVMSGQSTPGSNSGPSPTAWNVQNVQDLTANQAMSLGNGNSHQHPNRSPSVPGAGAGGNGSAGGFDFWSQVGGYDWASDPSVPFNI